MRPAFIRGRHLCRVWPRKVTSCRNSPAARYRAGLKALADHVKDAFGGKAFRDLAPADQDKVLVGLEDGSIVLKDLEGADFFALLLQNTQEGFFADPIYGGNRDMAGWKLVGFPGARYDYRDWVSRHNERLPAAAGQHHGPFRLDSEGITMATTNSLRKTL